MSLEIGERVVKFKDGIPAQKGMISILGPGWLGVFWDNGEEEFFWEKGAAIRDDSDLRFMRSWEVYEDNCARDNPLDLLLWNK